MMNDVCMINKNFDRAMKFRGQRKDGCMYVGRYSDVCMYVDIHTCICMRQRRLRLLIEIDESRQW